MSDQLDCIDNVLRRIDRELWIVTSSAGDSRGGLTATWVSQASIDRERPVVLIGIAPNHFTSELIGSSGAFALHLIGEQHIDHAWNFALGSGRDRDKLIGVPMTISATGSPLLKDCLAWLDCRVFSALPTGDRTYYWADVLDGNNVDEGDPLTEQKLISVADNEQKRALRASREYDVALQRPLQSEWRADLPDALRPG